MDILKLNIETITNEQVKNLAAIIEEVDGGYNERYTTEQINKVLFNLGVSCEEGFLLTSKTISGRKLEVSEMIAKHIG